MDDEILKTVHSIFGKGVKIVDCEKTASVRQEEILLINGIPVQLDNLAVDDADAIKAALLTGQMPSVDLLNQLLYQAGLLQQSVQLETTLSVKSSMVTTEEVSVSRDGRVLDQRINETKENYTYQSNKKEIWQPRLRDNNHTKNNVQQNVYGSCCKSVIGGGTTIQSLNSLECQANTTEPVIAPSIKQPDAIDLSKSTTFDAFNKFKNFASLEATDSVENADNYCNDNDDLTKTYDKIKQQNYNLDDCLSASSISNYSTYLTESDATTMALNTDRDSVFQLKYHGLPELRHTNSTASSVLQQLSDKKCSSSSYDSGHDELFHSISQSGGALVNPATANSLSSCYDEFICSSCDELSEADVLQLQLEKKPKKLAAIVETVQSDVNFLPTNAKKNHVSLQEVNDKHQMLPMSNNVKSGSSGSNNVSSVSTNKNSSNKTTSEGVTDLAATSSTTPTALSTSRNSFFSEAHGPQQYKVEDDCKQNYQFVKPQVLVTPQRQQKQQKKNKEAAESVPKIAQYHNESIDNLLVYCDGDLVSGSLETLIKHMVPTSNYYPESSYIFAFLLSARLFIRPHELLCKISTTWELQQSSTTDVVDDVNTDINHHNTSSLNSTPLFLRKPHSLSVKMTGKGAVAADLLSATYKDQKNLNTTQQSTQMSANNCIRLLEEWIETFPYDFRDERLMQQVRILARKCVYIDNSLGKKVSRILQFLVQRLTVLEKYEEFLQSLAASEINSSETQEQLPQQKIATTGNISAKGATACNPLGRSSTTDAYTGHSQKFLKSAVNSNHLLLPASASNTNSLTTKPIESQQYNTSQSLPLTLQQQQHHQQQHKHPYSDGSMNSVNFTLHHLTGTLSSASSVSDVQEIMDMCPSSEQLAHQLTAIELERLSHIGPEEFVQAFSKEYQHSLTMKKSSAFNQTNEDDCGVVIMSTSSSTSLSDFKKTRNLESYVQWFNHLSYFTATEIVKYSKKKQRVRVIEYWIETARECFNIGNFNSLMAIIAGLNLAPISRLKKTWSKVQSAKLSVLEHQMDPTSNFNSYRSTLKAAMWRSEGATDERERIIIPFFSLFVKDLYFLNEGCSNRLPNNHINFEKCTQLAKQVKEFNEWKKVICPFEKLQKVITFVQSSTVLNENTLSMASFECEPPENTQEKGRYKTLKSETKQQLQQLHEQQQQQN